MSTKFRTALNAAAVALVMALTLPITAHVGSVDSEFKYTPINGPSTGITFDKYLVMKEGLTVPNVDFEFTVGNKLNGETVARDQTETTMAVKEGPLTGTGGTGAPVITVTKPTGASTMFTNDTTKTPVYPSVQTGDNLELGENEQYAAQTVTVNLSAVSFNSPGIYRYIISETIPDDDDKYKGVNYTVDKLALDVFVVDVEKDDHTHELAFLKDGEGASAKPVYVLQRIRKGSGDTYDDSYPNYIDPKNVLKNETMGTDSSYKGLATDDKATGLINKYTATNLFFGKIVEGNQGSRDKYFKYTVTIGGLSEGHTLGVDVATGGKTKPTQTADTKYSPNTMYTEADPTADPPVAADGNCITKLVADADGTVTEEFFLQNGQYIKISDLPAGATYSVVEDAEGYLSTATFTDDDTATEDVTFDIGELTFSDAPGTVDDPETVGDSPIYTGYVNKRQGTVPTGVTMSYAPHAIIGSAALAGIVLLAVRRRKKEED